MCQSESLQSAFVVHALKLKSKWVRKLLRVIKMTKNTAIHTHLDVLFFFHSALSFCFCTTTGKTVGKNIDKQRMTSIFTCELKVMYEAQAIFFYSDLSSDLMLVPHILFINLTDGKKKNSTCTKGWKIYRILKIDANDGRTRTGRWKTGS